MALQKILQRYTFPDHHLNVMFQDYRIKINEIAVLLDSDNSVLKASSPTFAGVYVKTAKGYKRSFDRVFNVIDYGLVPDRIGSATKNVVAFHTLIADMSSGDSMYFPEGGWYIDDDLNVNKPVTIFGNGVGSEIRQITDAKYGFNVTVSNVTIKDLRLYGHSAPSANSSGSDAIRFVGTAGDPPTNLVNVKVIDCFIENWGMQGISAKYVDNFDFSMNYIKSITYAGIMGNSVQDGIILGNRIDDIKCHSNDNGYGIAITRDKQASLTAFPRSARVVMVSNVVTNVLLWDGISTHAAENCFFNNNTVRSTKRGINCVGDDTYAPLNNTISNNIVDLGSVIAGTGDAGVSFAGEDTSNLATGCITGNVIIGHGAEDSQISGGLLIKYTQGVAITGNRLINCASRGVMLYQNNYDFTLSGNTISDVWSATYDVCAIQVNSVNNIGYIGENSWANVTKSSDKYLGSGTSFGIYINNAAGNVISLGNNQHKDADTYISDAGSKAVTYTMVTDLVCNTITTTGHLLVKKAASDGRVILETYATEPGYDSRLYLKSSDSDTMGTRSVTQSGDFLGTIAFQGVDSGSNFEYGAYIRAHQVGAAGVTVPTDLEFSTYTDTVRNANVLRLGTGGNIFMGDNANAKNTKGLTINQGAADDEILALKSSDVAHGCTVRAETDTYGFMGKASLATGGLWVVGIGSSIYGLFMDGADAADNTDKDATALAPVIINTHKISGTNWGAFGADSNIFVIMHSNSARFIVDEDGDILYDGTAGAYQEHDDIELLAELEVNLDKSKKLKSKNKYKIKDLEDAKLLRPFLSTKRLNMLQMGAIRQMNEKIEALEQEIRLLKHI